MSGEWSRACCLAGPGLVLIVAYKSLGYGSKVMSPITKTWLNIMGVIYVDDTDLYIMDECVKSSIDI